MKELEAFNGFNLLDAPVFAPEERDVYSPEILEQRRSTGSEMFPVICVHCAPLERACDVALQAINILVLRSQNSCVKYIDTVETVSQFLQRTPEPC